MRINPHSYIHDQLFNIVDDPFLFVSVNDLDIDFAEDIVNDEYNHQLRRPIAKLDLIKVGRPEKLTNTDWAIPLNITDLGKNILENIDWVWDNGNYDLDATIIWWRAWSKNLSTEFFNKASKLTHPDLQCIVSEAVFKFLKYA